MFEENLLKRETRTSAAPPAALRRNNTLTEEHTLRQNRASSLEAPGCGFNLSLCNAIDVFGKIDVFGELGMFEKCRCVYRCAETFVRV